MSRHRITGAALVAGIAGNPVAHSLSPVIHNAWLAAGDIDGVYAPFAPADAAGFEALVAAGRAGLILGLNVTAPFKEQAFALADQATPAARLTASANILTFDAGRVSADSSDGIGLMLGLKEQAPDLTLAGRPVVMLGAGGAARARGLPTVDGLAMLIGQAAPSFQALFRRPPPPLDLRALLTAHLGEAP